jgi:uncharacterized protein YqhQ
MSQNSSPAPFTTIGGQAVLEGVMMRSPKFVAVAVRTPEGSIKIKSTRFDGVATRHPFLRKPFLRGVVSLFESLSLGMRALSFSAEIADPSSEAEKISKWTIALSLSLSFLFGVGLFVGLPHFIAWLALPVESAAFHILDGGVKLAVFLAYILAISQMKDIYRVFQYHGAEHQSIYTFEKGLELTQKNALAQTTLHPRCGTSFMLFLITVSILVFGVILPATGIKNHLLLVLVKVVLMLPVAGISYELIKISAFRRENAFFRALMWPGLMLQNLTTKVPDSSQVEVALASLIRVLKAEQAEGAAASGEESVLEIQSLDQLGSVNASVMEFQEK